MTETMANCGETQIVLDGVGVVAGWSEVVYFSCPMRRPDGQEALTQRKSSNITNVKYSSQICTTNNNTRNLQECSVQS